MGQQRTGAPRHPNRADVRCRSAHCSRPRGRRPLGHAHPDRAVGRSDLAGDHFRRSRWPARQSRGDAGRGAVRRGGVSRARSAPARPHLGPAGSGGAGQRIGAPLPVAQSSRRRRAAGRAAPGGVAGGEATPPDRAHRRCSPTSSGCQAPARADQGAPTARRRGVTAVASGARGAPTDQVAQDAHRDIEGTWRCAVRIRRREVLANAQQR